MSRSIPGMLRWGLSFWILWHASTVMSADPPTVPETHDVPALEEPRTDQASQRADEPRVRAGLVFLQVCLDQGPDPDKIGRMLLARGAESVPQSVPGRQFYRVPLGDQDGFGVLLEGPDVCNVFFVGSDAAAALADIDGRFRNLPDYATYTDVDATAGAMQGLERAGGRRFSMKYDNIDPAFGELVNRFDVYLMADPSIQPSLLLRRWFGSAVEEPKSAR